MKIKITISTLLVGLVATSAIMAAGFGVAGQAQVMQQSAAASQDPDHPLFQERQNAVPSSMRVDQAPPPLAGPNPGDPNAGMSPQQQPLQQPQQPQQQEGPPSDAAPPACDSPASQQAFGQSVRNLMPLSPDQIKTLHYMFDQSQRATAAYPGTPPRPTSSTVLVNLSPGATPPVIRLRSGYVSSLVFLDSTGQPWPIMAYDLGDPQSFNIAPNQPDGKNNTLLVQALDSYKSGNLAVMLKDHNTPVMVTLLPGQRAIDYRVDLRIPGLGPNAQPITGSIPDMVNPQLVNFLDGVPPQGAKTLYVDGGPSQAWFYGGRIYVRTRLTVLSPSWISTMSSPDGTHVYEMTKTPVVLASQNGSVVQLMIRGW